MKTKTEEYIRRQVRRMAKWDKKGKEDKSNRIGMELLATMRYINEMEIFTMDEMWKIIEDEENRQEEA